MLRAAILPKAFTSLVWNRQMPKIPVTSKRARTFLNAQPLVPDSVKIEAGLLDQSAKSKPVVQSVAIRRSSRLATNVKTEAIASPYQGKIVKTKPEVEHAQESPVQLKKAVSKPTKRSRTAVSTKAVKRERAAPGLDDSAGEELQTENRPSVKPKKQKPVKSNPQQQTEPDDKGTLVQPQDQPKSKRKAAASEGGNCNGASASATNAVANAKKAANRGKKRKPVSTSDAEKLKDADDGAMPEAEKPSEDAEPQAKKKKNRRGPAGFALRGEGVEDTPEGRRARLKAAREAGKSGIAERPLVLDSDVQRMCEELGNDRLGQTAPWQREANSIGGMKWWTGCHCSSSGGVDRAVINAAATGCRAFAMDVRCKVRWEAPPLTEETITAFKDACQKFGYGPEQILPHGSYLINLASPDPEMAKKGYGGFLEELQRCERLGLKLYNFHPGSTTGLCTHEEGMDRIAGFINEAHKATKGVTIVLENMSSVGNIVGGKMWHLKYVIDRVEDKSRIGICIDTCHLFSSGVDLRTEADCEAAFNHIDEVVGLKYLKGLHVNDSKTPFDSHRDRHENIGRGSIPMACFKWILNNPKFQGIPLIMETPVQEREAPVDFKKSLVAGKIWWKDPQGPYGVGTDRRDIILLNSLVEQTNWD